MTTEIFYPCGLFHISAPSDCLLKADTLFVGEQSYLWQACCMYCGHLFKLDDVRSSLKADCNVFILFFDKTDVCIEPSLVKARYWLFLL